MSVSNHEPSSFDFPGLPGIFDTKYPKVTNGWVSYTPCTGVMAEAVQTIGITSRPASDPLLAVGYKGHAGYSKRYGGVDLTIDAVLTDNVNVSGAYGYDLSDFESKLVGNFSCITTNRTNGKKVNVTGIYVNQITFNFNANDNCTTSWGFVADGVSYEDYVTAESGVVGDIDYHCVNPLTWDEVHIHDGVNNIILTGVQSATFTASLNRQDIFEIGQFEPYDRSVTHPYDVSVSINTLANDVRLTNWWDKFVASYDPSDDCANGLIVKIMTQSIAGHGSEREFIIASGLRPTNSTLNVAVGSNSTVALNFGGTSLRF